MNPRGGVVGRAGWTARLRMLDDFFAILPPKHVIAQPSFTMTWRDATRAKRAGVLLFSAAHAGGVGATSTRVGGVAVRTRQHELISGGPRWRRSAKGSSPSSPADWADVPTARIHAAPSVIDRKPPRQSPHSSPTSRASALVCSCARDHRFDASILWHGAILYAASTGDFDVRLAQATYFICTTLDHHRYAARTSCLLPSSRGALCDPA